MTKLFNIKKQKKDFLSNILIFFSFIFIGSFLSYKGIMLQHNVIILMTLCLQTTLICLIISREHRHSAYKIIKESISINKKSITYYYLYVSTIIWKYIFATSFIFLTIFSTSYIYFLSFASDIIFKPFIACSIFITSYMCVKKQYRLTKIPLLIISILLICNMYIVQVVIKDNRIIGFTNIIPYLQIEKNEMLNHMEKFIKSDFVKIKEKNKKKEKRDNEDKLIEY